MSEESSIESESIAQPAEIAEPAAAGLTRVWMAAGKQRLSVALQWLAQSLTKASAGLGSLASRVDAAGSSLGAPQ